MGLLDEMQAGSAVANSTLTMTNSRSSVNIDTSSSSVVETFTPPLGQHQNIPSTVQLAVTAGLSSSESTGSSAHDHTMDMSMTTVSSKNMGETDNRKNTTNIVTDVLSTSTRVDVQLASVSRQSPSESAQTSDATHIMGTTSHSCNAGEAKIAKSKSQHSSDHELSLPTASSAQKAAIVAHTTDQVTTGHNRVITTNAITGERVSWADVDESDNLDSLEVVTIHTVSSPAHITVSEKSSEHGSNVGSTPTRALTRLRPPRQPTHTGTTTGAAQTSSATASGSQRPSGGASSTTAASAQAVSAASSGTLPATSTATTSTATPTPAKKTSHKGGQAQHSARDSSDTGRPKRGAVPTSAAQPARERHTPMGVTSMGAAVLSAAAAPKATKLASGGRGAQTVPLLPRAPKGQGKSTAATDATNKMAGGGAKQATAKSTGATVTTRQPIPAPSTVAPGGTHKGTTTAASSNSALINKMTDKEYDTLVERYVCMKNTSDDDDDGPPLGEYEPASDISSSSDEERSTMDLTQSPETTQTVRAAASKPAQSQAPAHASTISSAATRRRIPRLSEEAIAARRAAMRGPSTRPTTAATATGTLIPVSNMFGALDADTTTQSTVSGTTSTALGMLRTMAHTSDTARVPDSKGIHTSFYATPVSTQTTFSGGVPPEVADERLESETGLSLDDMYDLRDEQSVFDSMFGGHRARSRKERTRVSGQQAPLPLNPYYGLARPPVESGPPPDNSVQAYPHLGGKPSIPKPLRTKDREYRKATGTRVADKETTPVKRVPSEEHNLAETEDAHIVWRRDYEAHDKWVFADRDLGTLPQSGMLPPGATIYCKRNVPSMLSILGMMGKASPRPATIVVDRRSTHPTTVMFKNSPAPAGTFTSDRCVAHYKRPRASVLQDYALHPSFNADEAEAWVAAGGILKDFHWNLVTQHTRLHDKQLVSGFTLRRMDTTITSVSTALAMARWQDPFWKARSNWTPLRQLWKDAAIMSNDELATRAANKVDHHEFVHEMQRTLEKPEESPLATAEVALSAQLYADSLVPLGAIIPGITVGCKGVCLVLPPLLASSNWSRWSEILDRPDVKSRWLPHWHRVMPIKLGAECSWGTARECYSITNPSVRAQCRVTVTGADGKSRYIYSHPLASDSWRLQAAKNPNGTYALSADSAENSRRYATSWDKMFPVLAGASALDLNRCIPKVGYDWFWDGEGLFLYDRNIRSYIDTTGNGIYNFSLSLVGHRDYPSRNQILLPGHKRYETRRGWRPHESTGYGPPEIPPWGFVHPDMGTNIVRPLNSMRATLLANLREGVSERLLPEQLQLLGTEYITALKHVITSWEDYHSRRDAQADQRRTKTHQKGSKRTPEGSRAHRGYGQVLLLSRRVHPLTQVRLDSVVAAAGESSKPCGGPESTTAVITRAPSETSHIAGLQLSALAPTTAGINTNLPRLSSTVAPGVVPRSRDYNISALHFETMSSGTTSANSQPEKTQLAPTHVPRVFAGDGEGGGTPRDPKALPPSTGLSAPPLFSSSLTSALSSSSSSTLGAEQPALGVGDTLLVPPAFPPAQVDLSNEKLGDSKSQDGTQPESMEVEETPRHAGDQTPLATRRLVFSETESSAARVITDAGILPAKCAPAAIRLTATAQTAEADLWLPVQPLVREFDDEHGSPIQKPSGYHMPTDLTDEETAIIASLFEEVNPGTPQTESWEREDSKRPLVVHRAIHRGRWVDINPPVNWSPLLDSAEQKALLAARDAAERVYTEQQRVEARKRLGRLRFGASTASTAPVAPTTPAHTGALGQQTLTSTLPLRDASATTRAGTGQTDLLEWVRAERARTAASGSNLLPQFNASKLAALDSTVELDRGSGAAATLSLGNITPISTSSASPLPSPTYRYQPTAADATRVPPTSPPKDVVKRLGELSKKWTRKQPLTIFVRELFEPAMELAGYEYKIRARLFVMALPEETAVVAQQLALQQGFDVSSSANLDKEMYTAWLTAVAKEYDPAPNVDAERSKLENMKMFPDESVNSFATRVEVAARRLTDAVNEAKKRNISHRPIDVSAIERIVNWVFWHNLPPSLTTSYTTVAATISGTHLDVAKMPMREHLKALQALEQVPGLPPKRSYLVEMAAESKPTPAPGVTTSSSGSVQTLYTHTATTSPVTGGTTTFLTLPQGLDRSVAQAAQAHAAILADPAVATAPTHAALYKAVEARCANPRDARFVVNTEFLTRAVLVREYPYNQIFRSTYRGGITPMYSMIERRSLSSGRQFDMNIVPCDLCNLTGHRTQGCTTQLTSGCAFCGERHTATGCPLRFRPDLGIAKATPQAAAIDPEKKPKHERHRGEGFDPERKKRKTDFPKTGAGGKEYKGDKYKPSGRGGKHKGGKPFGKPRDKGDQSDRSGDRKPHTGSRPGDRHRDRDTDRERGGRRSAGAYNVDVGSGSHQSSATQSPRSEASSPGQSPAQHGVFPPQWMGYPMPYPIAYAYTASAQSAPPSHVPQQLPTQPAQTTSAAQQLPPQQQYAQPPQFAHTMQPPNPYFTVQYAAPGQAQHAQPPQTAQNPPSAQPKQGPGGFVHSSRQGNP